MFLLLLIKLNDCYCLLLSKSFFLKKEALPILLTSNSTTGEEVQRELRFLIFLDVSGLIDATKTERERE